MTLFVLVSSSLLFVAFAFFVRYAADAHFEESDNAESPESWRWLAAPSSALHLVLTFPNHKRL